MKSIKNTPFLDSMDDRNYHQAVLSSESIFKRFTFLQGTISILAIGMFGIFNNYETLLKNQWQKALFLIGVAFLILSLIMSIIGILNCRIKGFIDKQKFLDGLHAYIETLEDKKVPYDDEYAARFNLVGYAEIIKEKNKQNFIIYVIAAIIMIISVLCVFAFIVMSIYG